MKSPAVGRSPARGLQGLGEHLGSAGPGAAPWRNMNRPLCEHLEVHQVPAQNTSHAPLTTHVMN